MNNWVEVSEEALRGNFEAIRRRLGGGVEALAVIKANAYGHGAERCAAMLVRAGAKWLGVTSAGEGVRVRRALEAAGLGAEILVMCGFLPEDVGGIGEAGLTAVLWTREQVGWLAGVAGCKVHVEVDTGMGRQGVLPGAELDELLEEIRAAGVGLEGIFTHFCSAEEVGSGLTLRQEKLFEGAVGQAAGSGVRYVHAGNSSAVDNPVGPEGWLEGLAGTVGARGMVRTGIALYGFCLPTEEPKLRGELQPVMTWKARVLAVRDLAPGETVGYNATFRAERRMRVALLGVGYADGLRRELSGLEAGGAGGWVMVRGERARILGRISMNLTVVDVSGIAGVQAGEEATVLGAGITADDHARLAGTIVYEILCGVHPCG